MIRAGARAAVEIAALTRDLPDLRVLAGAGALGAVGAGLLNPVLPVYLQSRGLDLERIGLVFTLGSLLPVFLQPALGALSDRVGRKWILVGVYLSASLIIPALAFISHPLPLAAALCARLMLDRSVAPLRAAAMGDVAPAAQRATVFGLLASAVNLVLVAALVASSAVVALLGHGGVLAVGGGFFLASGIALLGLRGARPSPAPLPAPPGAGPREGRPRAPTSGAASILAPIAYARRSPALAALFAYQFCFTFAIDAFPIYLPLFAVKLGAPEAWVGPLIATSWLVFALVQPFGGRLSDRGRGRKGLIAGGLVGMAAAAALLGAAGWAPAPLGLPLMACAWVLIAIPDGLFRPSAEALLVDLAPPAERGRFLGALGSAAALANVAAPLCYGVVARRVAPGAAFLLASGALLAALLAIGRVREPGRAPAAPLTAPTEAP